MGRFCLGVCSEARRAVQPEVWAPLHPLHQSSQGPGPQHQLAQTQIDANGLNEIMIQTTAFGAQALEVWI